MDVIEKEKLRSFLGSTPSIAGCNLYLPRFSGMLHLADDQFAGMPPLKYPGDTFSDHDAKAALYVTSLLSHVIDPGQIHFAEASTFAPGFPISNPTFMFGSRSNKATMWAANSLGGNRFGFNFGPLWEIKLPKGVFSLPDPSSLDKISYAQNTDYGIISRLTPPRSQGRIFVIAGLGARATEGCGYYLSVNWDRLFAQFGAQNDFTVVLEFPPAVDVKKANALMSNAYPPPAARA